MGKAKFIWYLPTEFTVITSINTYMHIPLVLIIELKYIYFFILIAAIYPGRTSNSWLCEEYLPISLNDHNNFYYH